MTRFPGCRGLFGWLFLVLLAPQSLPGQLREDNRVPADKKAVVAINVDVEKLYGNRLVKMLADMSMDRSASDLPFAISDLTKISAFIAAPKGTDLLSLEKTNFYVFIGFKSEEATGNFKDRLISTGGREVEINGKKLIGPPDGSEFYVDVQPKYAVVGTEDYLTSPTNQFATAKLAATYSALPQAPIRIAVDFDGAREVMDEVHAMADASAEFLTKPYVSLLKEVSTMTMTSDFDQGSLVKLSLNGHDDQEGKKIKQKMDALVGLVKQMAESGPGDDSETMLLGFLKDLEAKQDGLAVTVEAAKPEGFEETVTKMIGSARAAAKAATDMNNFRQVLLAMHNYHDVYRELPFNKHLAGEDSGKGLSWAVYCLPFLEQQALYETFDLNEAFDSPQNAKAAQTVIPTLELNTGGTIKWVRPAKVPKSFSNITDGLSNTVVFVQSRKVDMAPWTKATSIRPAEVLEQFKSLKDGEFMIFGMYDGSVRRVTNQDDIANIEGMLEPADGKYPEWE